MGSSRRTSKSECEPALQHLLEDINDLARPLVDSPTSHLLLDLLLDHLQVLICRLVSLLNRLVAEIGQVSEGPRADVRPAIYDTMACIASLRLLTLTICHLPALRATRGGSSADPSKSLGEQFPSCLRKT